MPTHQSVFQNPHLDGRSFTLAGGKTGILLFHGFTATTIEVRPLSEFLHNHGFSVRAPLLPGHGTTPEDLLTIRWQDWVDTAEDAYQEMLREVEHVFVGGESLGGLLALSLANRHAKIQGILLFAPVLQVKGIWRAAVMAPFRKIQPKSYGGFDPEGHAPWQGYRVIAVPAANQLRKYQKVVKKFLPDVLQPLLIFQGKFDHTIDPRSSQIVFERIGSKHKELIWLKQSGHCVLLDIERSQVFQKTLEFIRELSESSPAADIL